MPAGPKTAKLANQGLREYVEDRLSGQIRLPDGAIVADGERCRSGER